MDAPTPDPIVAPNPGIVGPRPSQADTPEQGASGVAFLLLLGAPLVLALL